ncbi:MAG: 4Fe-4S binding protein [Methermicoccaceae archaeon]
MKKLMIEIERDVLSKPIIAEVILETGAKLNIERAKIDSESGEVVLNVPAEDVENVKQAFHRRSVHVRPIVHPVVRDENACIHCGACISVCPVGVFSFGEDGSVVVDEEKCIMCGTCITMCPMRALKIS